jgi:hypothetical protein
LRLIPNPPYGQSIVDGVPYMVFGEPDLAGTPSEYVLTKNWSQITLLKNN